MRGVWKVSENDPRPVDPRYLSGAVGSSAAGHRPQPVERTHLPSDPTETGRASGAELARQALARARAEAKARGASPRGVQRSRRSGRLRPRNEPQLFGDAVRTWLIEHGWQEQVAIGGVFGRWADIVGEFNAQRLRPKSYSDGELVVVADSPTMAAQARSMVRDLIRRLNEELGDGTVVTIKIEGPGFRRHRGH